MDSSQVNMDVADWWINKAATYGLAFCFLAIVLLIVLWATISLIKIAKEWIPQWFKSSIDSHQRVADSIDSLVESIDCIHQKTHSVHDGLRSTLRGANAYLRKNKVRLGISSDAIVHLEAAQEVLDSIPMSRRHHHRGEEEANDRTHEQTGTGESNEPAA